MVCKEQLAPPPAQNFEAERRALGCAILSADSRAMVIEQLSPDDFFHVVHRKVFQFLRDLTDYDDLEFRLCSKLPEYAAGIASLVDGLHAKADVTTYIGPIIEAANRRRIHFAANRALQDNESDPHEIAQMLRSITMKNARGKLDPLQVRAWGDILPLDMIPEGGDDYLVERLIPRGGVAMIAGEPGAYKSWLAQSLSWSVATGRRFLNFQTQETPVVYFDRENTPRRVRKRAEVLGIDLADSRFKVWTKLQAPPALGDPRLIEIAKTYAPLMVFDTVIRFSPGTKDENSSSDVARALSLVAELTYHGASVLLLHHKGKDSGGPWYRGSSDYGAFIDVGLSVQLTDKTRGILKLTCEKARDGEPFTITLQARPYLDEMGGFAVLIGAEQTADELDISKIIAAVTDNPGMSQHDLVVRSGLSEKRVRTLLSRLDGKQLEIRDARGHQKAIFLASQASALGIRPDEGQIPLPNEGQVQ